MSGWVGVDFDGTLCAMNGTPVPKMVERIKRFLAQGVEVRIVTARVNSRMTFEHQYSHRSYIQIWCDRHLGQVLEVQAEKDYDMIILYDDRAIAVQTDTGECRGWNPILEVEVGQDT